GLRDGVVVAGRTSDGDVVVPPPEYDPVTHPADHRLRRGLLRRHGDLLDLGARAGLRDGVVVAGRTSDGDVVVPPPEYDPVTHPAD
ncbi:hypothetical protein, partial [Escherichia coli]|uniref:hypothetical protein n=1 Tax=Escherichia coli TaxID=562 RepID=UPI001BC86B6E